MIELPQATVVKVGGSLLDLPNIGLLLAEWVHAHVSHPILLVGGGPTTDVVRWADRHHRLGEEQAHWLALRALSLNSHLLAMLMPAGRVVRNPAESSEAWKVEAIPILDPFPFASEDEARADHLPHQWHVTSDSLAGRLARVIGARELVILKSCSIPQGSSWPQLAAAGIVDGWFPRLVPELPSTRLVAFRDVVCTRAASS